MTDASPPTAGGMDGVRRPPYSDEAERGVLGSILQDARIMDLAIEGQITVESFYVPGNRIVFEAILEMSKGALPIDVLTVTDRLRKDEQLDRLGGEVFLHRLIDSTPTTAHASYYIGIVNEKRILRRIIECARNAETQCYDTEESAPALLGRVEQSFFDITDQQRDPVASWSDTVKKVMSEIDTISQGGEGIIKSGFKDIDTVMSGLRSANMIVLAARPSMGKTSLAMNIAENVARGHTSGGEPVPVGIFSLEMSQEDLVLRMLCSFAEVSMHDIRQGRLGDKGESHRRLVTAADTLGKTPLYLDDSAGLDVVELRARARRLKQKYNVQLIVIDYLQLLHSREHARQGRQYETAAISSQIKGMAKELKLPVIVLSQLSRAPEARDAGKPRLSDLRDSGSIEQDADVVLLLRRPCRYADDKENQDDRRLAIVDIAKNRNGPAQDDIRLNFEESFTRFSDRTEDHGVDGFGPDAEFDDDEEVGF